MDTPTAKTFVISKTPRDYFSEAVETAAQKQGVRASAFAIAYIVGVLTDFERREALFSDSKSEKAQEGDHRTIESLTQLFLTSYHNPSISRPKLQRAGDVALLLTGFFQETYHRKHAPSLTYHQEIGSSAYHRLSRITRGFSQHVSNEQSLGDVFEELSNRFIDFAEVLAEVAERSHSADETGLLHLYQRWQREDKPYRRRLLREKGIIALSGMQN